MIETGNVLNRSTDGEKVDPEFVESLFWRPLTARSRRLPAWHRIGITMKNEELREYQVIWWTDDPARPRERLTVLAMSLDDASKQIKDKFGSNIKTSIWNEEDAAKPR